VLWLARHGETDANAGGLLQGQRDHLLSERGRRQAELLAAALPLAPTLVVTSPLLRARDTATAYGHPVTVDDRWREIGFGDWEGRHGAELLPLLWRERATDPEWAPPGGESLPAVGRRVRAALEELWADAARGEVVVFTHASPVKVSVAAALGAPVEVAGRMHLEVAALTRIRVEAVGPRLLAYNDVCHLRAAGALSPLAGPYGASPPGLGTGGRGG